MEFLLPFLEYFAGEDTDPVDLLPLVVLAFMTVGIRHLRTLLLRVLVELGALRERIDIKQSIDRFHRPKED